MDGKIKAALAKEFEGIIQANAHGDGKATREVVALLVAAVEKRWPVPKQLRIGRAKVTPGGTV